MYCFWSLQWSHLSFYTLYLTLSRFIPTSLIASTAIALLGAVVKLTLVRLPFSVKFYFLLYASGEDNDFNAWVQRSDSAGRYLLSVENTRISQDPTSAHRLCQLYFFVLYGFSAPSPPSIIISDHLRSLWSFVQHPFKYFNTRRVETL